ncbi:MAG: deoxyribose-phosphate aldolase [Clostridia bacterium]
MSITVKEIAKMIDHSLLQPHMTPTQVKEGCEIAKQYDCASVCVKPSDVPLAKSILDGTDVKVSTVIGFPHGAHTTATKLFEANEAMDNGCVELDMVMNIGRMIDGDTAYVAKDIKAVVDLAHARNVIVKVILENCYLTDAQKVDACKICEAAGADFVKTSTGYGTGGATLPDLKLMRATVSAKVRVKAAGGVRTLDQALAVKAVGAVRFGATATAVILQEAQARQEAGTLKEASEAELGGAY